MYATPCRIITYYLHYKKYVPFCFFLILMSENHQSNDMSLRKCLSKAPVYACRSTADGDRLPWACICISPLAAGGPWDVFCHTLGGIFTVALSK